MDVTLKIDGVEATAPDGTSLLDVARRAGREIPSLCHHEALPAIGSCRLCLVEVRRPGRDEAQLTTSCDYPALAGLEVVTDSELIRNHRAMNLQLLLARAPEAPALRELAAGLNVADPLFPPVAGAPLQDCILCELCVRVCSALGYNALAAIGRGDHKHVGPPFGQQAAMSCVGCGSCHEVCPTGCISLEDTATTRSIWGRTLELVACARCGTPFMTSAHRAAMLARKNTPADFFDLCESCKGKSSARRLSVAR